MNINGELTVKARREVVFDAVRNARFFASCIAGVSELTEIDPTHYAAVMEAKISFMRFKFKVTVELVRVESPREIEARIEGRPLGFLGRLTAVSVTTLTEAEEETRLRYAIDVALTGKFGSMGKSAFSATAREMSRQFGDNLRAALESRTCEVAP
ncbi:MAG: SRPBCC family protein [Betaproteobacteria bacterium]|nr:SRPBCC family protein [Betaproteobacteria bacterium]